VLALLDEESRFPKGTDESFLKKINEAHNKHKNYEMPRRKGINFIIKHYAGDVHYPPVFHVVGYGD
jgi:myosin-7